MSLENVFPTKLMKKLYLCPTVCDPEWALYYFFPIISTDTGRNGDIAW